MPKYSDHRRARHFKKAHSFINALQITSREWSSSGGWDTYWIFRGQSDGNKPLIPAAWRVPNPPNNCSNNADFMRYFRASEVVNRFLEDTVNDYWQKNSLTGVQNDIRKKRILDILIQVSVEFRSVNAFIGLADSVGHSIEKLPTIEEFTIKYLDNLVRGTSNSKIWEEDVFALVQHHGIPTRLLDWTTNPLIAAFFAADGVKENSLRQNSKIAVFAYLPNFVANTRIKSKRLPRSKSSYLHAQSGLFTYDTLGDNWYIEHGTWPSLEEVVDYEAHVTLPDGKRIRVINNLYGFRKFTLPASEAGELLRLLWLQGISRAHLMPTLDNVAEALKKKMFWVEKIESETNE